MNNADTINDIPEKLNAFIVNSFKTNAIGC